MLNLRASPEAEAIRRQFTAWLENNRPPQVKSYSSLGAFVEAGRRWQETLASGAWVGLHWPKEFGGRSLSLVEEAVVQEELARARSPQVLGLFGLTMVGPVLIKHGNLQQKHRFLSKILSAEEIWCQGFSEPGAGSDLAAVRTQAAPVEGGYVINGQKVWTSFAQIADWCFVLCRTEKDSVRHRGLTYLLVDMRSKGVRTQPLRQITGEDEFNEVFFDNVFVPSEMVVGNPGDGWKIAISTLMYERVVLTFARQLQSEVALRGLIDQSRQMGKECAVSLKVGLAREIARACAVRALAYQHLSHYAKGGEPGAEGSFDKLFWSESFQSIAELGLKFLGSKAALDENNPDSGDAVMRYLYSRGRTIAAGTSEIQRNIIAERVLQLPRLSYS